MRGSFERTLNAIRWSNEAHLPVQVNTTISTRNLHDLENMAKLLENFHIVLWSIFFLVPTGRGQAGDLPSAEQFEQGLLGCPESPAARHELLDRLEMVRDRLPALERIQHGRVNV